MRNINKKTIDSILKMYMRGTRFVINNGIITKIKNPTADQSTQGKMHKYAIFMFNYNTRKGEKQ